jgi:hypothetical protein
MVASKPHHVKFLIKMIHRCHFGIESINEHLHKVLNR